MAGRISKKCIWKQVRRNLGKWFESYRLLQGEQIFHLRESERWVASEKIYNSDAGSSYILRVYEEAEGKVVDWASFRGLQCKMTDIRVVELSVRCIRSIDKSELFFHSCKRIPSSLAEISASTYWRSWVLFPSEKLRYFYFSHPQYNYIFIDNIL